MVITMGLWDLVLFVYYQCSKILKLVNIALFWRTLLVYGSLNIHIFSSFQSPKLHTSSNEEDLTAWQNDSNLIASSMYDNHLNLNVQKTNWSAKPGWDPSYLSPWEQVAHYKHVFLRRAYVCCKFRHPSLYLLPFCLLGAILQLYILFQRDLPVGLLLDLKQNEILLGNFLPHIWLLNSWN